MSRPAPHSLSFSLDHDIADFEDAVQYVICIRNSCDVLATRNIADCGNKPGVLEPAKLIERIKAEGV